MTALARSRNTPRMAVDGAGQAPRNHPVNGGSILFAGGIGCLNSEGNLVPGSTATGLICVGRIENDCDNSAGADAALSCDVRPGVYRYVNGDVITKAHIGDLCYITDDQTVSKGSGGETKSGAGIIVDVDSSGVWVAMGLAESQLAAILLATTAVT